MKPLSLAEQFCNTDVAQNPLLQYRVTRLNIYRVHKPVLARHETCRYPFLHCRENDAIREKG